MAKTAAKKSPKPDALAAWAGKSDEPEEAPTDLKRVTCLARLQLELEAKLAQAQEGAQEVQRQLDQVRRQELPAALSEAGLQKFTMDDGSEVALVTEYTASLAGEKKQRAIEWLESVGLGSLVTLDLLVELAKGEDKLAKKVEALLKKTFKKEIAAGKLRTSLSQGVNTTSFKAVIRERLEAGQEVPTEELGVFVIDTAKIKRPKPKKGEVEL